MVTGTPQLALETGTSDGVAHYTNGSGTKTLVFNYTVLSDHNSNDLNYKNPASALTLNGGTIKDLVGNSASTVLPPAGTPADVKDIIIDNVPPQLLSANLPTDTLIPANSNAVLSFNVNEIISMVKVDVSSMLGDAISSDISSNNSTINVQVYAPLTSNDELEFTIFNLQDAAGNVNQASFSYTYNTSLLRS